jgi:lambda family phage tail tape measure protein
MSGTIAQLGLEVDSGDAVQAATDLDKLTAAGVKAEKAADDVAAGFKKTAASANELAAAEEKAAQATDDAKARLLALAKASLEASQYHQSLTTSVSSTSGAMNASGSSAASLAALEKKLKAESDALVGSIDSATTATAKAAAATGVQAESLDKLLNKLHPARGAIANHNKDLETLSKAYKAGEIDVDKYTAAVGTINGKLRALSGEGSAFDKLNLGTRQAQENVSQLANAISAGDLNSGARAIAQLGVGAGASAAQLGKLLLPGAALVAVLGSVAYGFVDAEREASAFNKSIFAGGNTVGVSAQQLQEIAKQAGVVTHNFAGARDAAIALAASGKVTGSELANQTEAASAIASYTGDGATEVAKALSGMGTSATDAAVKISEQYGLITSAQYLAIKAIEDNGDAQKALDLLSEDLNKSAQERLAQYRASLSDIELGWDDIKNSIAGAYSAIRSELFPDLTKQIEIVQRVLDTRKGGGVAGALSNGLSRLNSALGLDDGENDDSTAALEKKLAALKARQAASQALAATTGEVNAANKELIAVQRDLDRQLDNVTPLAKRDAATKKLKDQFTQLYQDAAKTGQASPLLTGVDFDGKNFSGGAYDKLLAGINSKNKDAKGPANQVDLSGFNDAQNALKELQATYSNTEKQLEASQKAGLISQEAYVAQRSVLISAEKEEVTAAYNAEIAALEVVRDKSSTTAQQRIAIDQKIADARTAMLKAQKDADSEHEVLATAEKGRLDKQTYSINQYVQALGQQQKALELAGQRAVIGVGRGDREGALDAQLNSQQDRFAQQSLDLENQRADPSRNMSEEEFAKKSQALADANRKATDQIRQNYADVEAAQGNWTSGASAAWENYLDSAKNIAGQTKSLFGNAFSSMEDAVVNFALTGKLSFSSFAKSILADMARIATRQASSSLLSSLFGAGLSYFSGSGTGSESLGASQAGYSQTYFPQAKGGAWSNGVQMFADGAAFTNSVVSKPTAFGMADGKTGVMGEAGDEAIMPLTRTSSGALGVRSVGGGSSSISISAPVSVVTQDRSGEGMQLDQTALQQNLQKQMKSAAEKAVADSWRAGGVSYRNSTGRG